MSGSTPRSEPSAAAAAALTRLAVEAGAAIRAARRSRRWTLRELAGAAGMAISVVHRIESGLPSSLESYARIGVALGVRPELLFTDGRHTVLKVQPDLVHAWMGDSEAGHIQRFRLPVSLDEPYQHFQFAGRGDVVSWSLGDRAFLHIENRTRFPNLQEAAGSFNAKREYLADAVAKRVGLRGGWRSQTHVMACLWSGEVQHVLRLRTATFRAICPDPPDAFAAWWAGTPPERGVATCLVLFDPQDRPRARRFVGLDDALRADARYRGYAEAGLAITGIDGQPPRFPTPSNASGSPAPRRSA
jgi:transcriptional regulator with XRE-family HTH domain